MGIRSKLMDAKKTGNLISEKRKEKGLTQKQLADLLSVSDRAVSKWERGSSIRFIKTSHARVLTIF